MNKSKRLHIHAGIIMERYKPGYVSPSVSDIDLLDELEALLNMELRDKTTEEVHTILNDVLINGISGINASVSSDDAYTRAMGVI